MGKMVDSLSTPECWLSPMYYPRRQTLIQEGKINFFDTRNSHCLLKKKKNMEKLNFWSFFWCRKNWKKNQEEAETADVKFTFSKLNLTLFQFSQNHYDFWLRNLLKLCVWNEKLKLKKWWEGLAWKSGKLLITKSTKLNSTKKARKNNS